MEDLKLNEDDMILGYDPTPEQEAVIQMVKEAVDEGVQILNHGRREFNDMSALERDALDWESFNTYQENDGIPNQNDPTEAWKSNAIRPVERNKCISIAGHAGKRLGFVKVTAMAPGNVPHESASLVVNSLLDHVRATRTTEEFWTNSILTAEVSPAAYTHVEYQDVYRKRKTTRKQNGEWNYKEELDEDLSGIQLRLVPFEQVLYPNMTEPNIQLQDWVVRRRFQTYDLMKTRYGKHNDFQYVRPGFRAVRTDMGYTSEYDPILQGKLCEEAIFYTKKFGGMRVVTVNNVLVTEHDEKLPREDGKYPLAKYGYELIRPDFALYKSLVFKASRDANIINTLYPVLVDGAILDSMPPTYMTGTDMVDANVVIPGVTTTVTSPDAKVGRILPPMSTFPMMQALGEVEKSLTETADVRATGGKTQSNVTNYQIQQREDEIENALGPFRSMLVSASIQLTHLVLGDILQHMTTLDAVKTVGSGKPVYRSFISPNTGVGQSGTRSVQFEDMSMINDVEKEMSESYELLAKEGDSDTKLLKADPKSLRELSMSIIVTDDILRPRSESSKLERNMQMFDKLIAASQAMPGSVDLAKSARDLLLVLNETTARDPDSYVKSGEAQQQPQPQITNA